MKITDKEVIQETIGMNIVEDVNEVFPEANSIPHPPEITTKKELTTMDGIAPTQEIIEDLMKDLDMTKEETAHTREDLMTDLGTTKEVTRDHQGTEEATLLVPPETEINNLTLEDVTGEIEIGDLTLEDEIEEVHIRDLTLGDVIEETEIVGLLPESKGVDIEMVKTFIDVLKITDLQAETIIEMNEVEGDTRQGLNQPHRVDIDLQAITEVKTNLF